MIDLTMVILVSSNVFFVLMWLGACKAADHYKMKFEVADEMGKFQSDKADGLLAELEESQKSAELRMDSIYQYITDLSNANNEVAKLKAENAALKDWQPMKDNIEKMMSMWLSPVGYGNTNVNPYSPVTCQTFVDGPDITIESQVRKGFE